MIEVNYVHLGKLEVSNSYLIMNVDTTKTLLLHRESDIELYLIEIKDKLDNSILIYNHTTNKESWYSSQKIIILFDHVPIKYLRKNKIQAIDKKNR